MFSSRNILLIQKFDFEDGVSPLRDKYLIILLQTDSDAIIAPLTTSKDCIPDHYKVKRCIKDDPSCIHCYFMPKAFIVGQNGFAFTKDTYVHIHPSNLKRRSISLLQTKYQYSGAAVLKDTLNDGEYSDFLYCLYKSHHVPRGVKKSIEPIIEKLEQSRKM